MITKLILMENITTIFRVNVRTLVDKQIILYSIFLYI